jgi:hypothetical protein
MKGYSRSNPPGVLLALLLAAVDSPRRTFPESYAKPKRL